MKIAIAYKFKDGPWGGANQYLKALKKEMIQKNIFADNISQADALLLNGNPLSLLPSLDSIIRFKRKRGIKFIVLRLDGPIFLVRGKDIEIDHSFKKLADFFVDGIIYQSNWSRQCNKLHFGIDAPFEATIYNSPDNEKFNKLNRSKVTAGRRINLIASSWSDNTRKGFNFYQYLDSYLNFDKYQMTFVGNSPIKFKNIHHILPLKSEDLSAILKKHDIFIFASQNEPCSNALLEAMACGLPVVAVNSGSNLELLKNGGVVFEGTKDMIEKIDFVANNYDLYQSQIPEYSIATSSEEYGQFFEQIFQQISCGKYNPKKFTLVSNLEVIKLKLSLKLWSIRGFLLRKASRLFPPKSER